MPSFADPPVPEGGAGGNPEPSPPPATRLEIPLFLFALLVYIATRFIGLTDFPIFFFSDEALQGNLASQLLENKFRDHTGTLLPPYFLNDRRWAVSLSVYIHLIPVWLLGKSVFLVRATSVAVTVLGVAASAVLLRSVFKNRFWWAAPLVLAAMPVFFLHARIGFEAIMMASFYGCFLCAYLLYRYRSPLYIFAALLFGAATFYAYTAGQGVMLVIGVFLLLSDFRYHMRQKKALLAGALLFAALLALPYGRYRRLHPGVVEEQLAVLRSYWVEPIPVSEKVARFGRTYLQGFDPRYWFRPNEKEIVRHRMKGMAYFPPAYLPLLAVGVGTCLWNFRRSPAHRCILFSPLGVPFAAAAAEIQILRLLGMIMPVALLVTIGIDQIARWLRRLLPPTAAAVLCAGALTVAAGRLTWTALVDGPLWYGNYGLHGMQWGARQVFGAIREELAESPDTRVVLTPTWANNTDQFVPFFLDEREQQRVRIGEIGAFNFWKQPLSEDDLFVMTPEEFHAARASNKVSLETPERVIPFPDGKPGFYFVRLRYVENVDEIFAAEREARKQLVEASLSVGGSPVTVRHSLLDGGTLPEIFDGRNDTLMRGFEANPFILELLFPKPRQLEKLRVTLASMPVIRIRLRVTPAEGGEPRESESVYRNTPPDPEIEIPMPGGPLRAEAIRLEITDVSAGSVTHVHIRELSFH